MYPANDKARSSISFLVIFIAFAWVGGAYIMGTEAKRMILHPVVPVLLILLLLGFRTDDSVRRAITVAIALISLWLFARLRSVFTPFIIGFSLAYVVHAALSGLQNLPVPLPKGRKVYIPRRTAVLILLLLLVGIMAFFILGIVPQLVEQGKQMKEGITNFYSRIRDYTTNMLARMEQGDYPFKDRIPESWHPTIKDASSKMSSYVQEKIPSTVSRGSELLAEILATLSSGLRGTMGHISSALFILIVFIYTVQSFQSHMEKLRDLFPANHQDALVRYVTEIDTNMRSFLKGQLTVIVIISVISAIAYSIIGVPFALLVGLLAGLCNAIPTIGPIIGGGIAVLASIVGFVGGNYGLTRFLIQLALVIGVSFGIQFLDNSLISPKIMSRTVEVHPLVVLFAVLLSASLIGIWGAVLAIPGIVVFKAVIKVSREIRTEREAREMRLET